MIRAVAVLGAGTMGAQLAGHAANAGLEVTLFDLTEAAARAGLARLTSVSPPAIFTPDVASRIRTAGFDDLRLAGAADWIVEAVVESLDAKRDLLARLEPHLGPQAIVSSNTSAIPLREIAEGRGERFRRRWLGTHFFNPPRYRALVELVPTADTDPAVVSELDEFLDRTLGKDVVTARDTPGFIGNRLALYGAVCALELWASGEFTLEDIEAATGPLVGGPPSATFRTIDLVGVNVVAAVADDLARRLPGEGYELPSLVGEMVTRGLVGVKAGRGFYRRAAPGAKRFLALDPATLEYREPATPDPALTDTTTRLGDRVKRLLQDASRAGDLVRRTTGAMLLHAATVGPEIAQSLADVDRAMRAGYGWTLGPFELWDAIGVRAAIDALRPAVVPPMVRAALDRGRDALRDGPLAPARPDHFVITRARHAGRVVRSLRGATLLDLGDGVFGVELHAPKHVINADTLEMLRAGVAHASAHGVALVVGSDGAQFAVGADLRPLLAAAQALRWTELDAMVRTFQDTMMAIKLAAVPVVAAPAGLTLGGGCELCLHATQVVAAAETYMGLPETSLGLIPAGGGAKELVLRKGAGIRFANFVNRIPAPFVSTSAHDAQRAGYLRDEDEIVMHRGRVTAAAKDAALARARTFSPRAPLDAIPAGGTAVRDQLAAEIDEALRRGDLTEHDALVARTLAHVVTGGSAAGHVSEQQLLDLEREAFLRLCGEPKTIERIAYTLKTGQALRN